MIGRIGAGGPCDASEFVMEGDLLLSVDAFDVRNAALKDIHARIQGAPFTPVTLELLRDPNPPHKVTLTRMSRNLSEGEPVLRTSAPPHKATTPPRSPRSPSPVILSPRRSAPTQGPLGVPPLFSKSLPSGEDPAQDEAVSLSREELLGKVLTPNL